MPVSIGLLNATALSALVDGTNIIAVEIHQQSPSSSDISFDLELRATLLVPAGLTSNEATVTVEVLPVLDGPVAVDDAVVTAEDDAADVAVLDNDRSGQRGLPIDLASVLVFDGPLHGSVAIDPFTGVIQYVPATDFTGGDSFRYVVFDAPQNPEDGPGHVSNVATVSITVTPTPDPPDATDDLYFTDEDEELIVTAVAGVLANDIEPDGEPMSARLVTPPVRGTLTFTADGAFRYRPDDDFFGTDQFTYLASDGQADSRIATVAIVVAPTPDDPVALDDAFSLRNGPASIETLVPAGANWRFIDDGAAQPTAWRRVGI